MENEQYTDELEVETQDEQLEDVVEETTDDDDSADDSEAVEFAKAKAEAAKYRRLYEKAIKPKPAPQAKEKAPQASASVEETVLLANGMPEELLEKLKKVAQVEGISLLKAKKDPVFIALQDKFEKDQLQEKASMGASRGSGSVKPKKDFATPGLSRDEHKKMFEERFNS